MIKCLLVIPWLNTTACTNSTLLLKMPNNKANKALWRLWKVFFSWFLGFFLQKFGSESITGCGLLPLSSWDGSKGAGKLLLIGIKKKKKQQLDLQEEAAWAFSHSKNQKFGVLTQIHFCLNEFTATPKLPGWKHPCWAQVRAEKTNRSLTEIISPQKHPNVWYFSRPAQ